VSIDGCFALQFGDDGYSQADWVCASLIAHPLEIRQLIRGGVEADLKSLDFAEPSVEPGVCDPLFQVGDDGNESWSRCWVQSKAWASDTRVLMLAAGSVGASAFSEFELAFLEVLLEVSPFLIGWFAVFGLGTLGAPLVEEGAIGAHELVIEDRHVGVACVQVGVSE
jgi:hypothetical protein